jgi:hypothetical protein
MDILKIILIPLLVSNLFGCFSFPAPTVTPTITPEVITAPPLVTPMPDLPAVYNSRCPANSGLILCYDRPNSDKLTERLTILYGAAKDCHM